MENSTNEAYSELYEIIELLDEEYIDKIPKDVYDSIKNNRDIGYINKFNTFEEINPNDISEKTAIMLTKIFMEYLANDEEKKEIEELLKENDRLLHEKYNPDNLFKKKKVEHQKEQEELALVEVKESIFKRILKKVLSIFKK